MANNDNILIHYAEGTGTNFARAKNKATEWNLFCEALSTPTRTKESRREFNNLSKDEQDRLKSVDGWISGAQCEGKWRNRRNVTPRDNITLDLDYPNDDILGLLRNGGTILRKYEFFFCTTRRHTKEAPRVRLFIPVSRKITTEEYGPLVRIFSWYFDNKIEPMVQVDKVSARPAQMMFKPTSSRDGAFESGRQEGNLLNPDNFFKQFGRDRGDWLDLSTLPLFDTEASIRAREAKAENPLSKRGPVGVWCRAYENIEDVMSEHLEGSYLQGDDHSGKPRYTYAGSTSSNGAIIEDDGLFLYSHHGHDPCCEMNVNAFDLVRIHKFGDLDEDIDADTPMPSRPSFTSMLEYVKEDKKYKNQLTRENYDLTAMFDDLSETDDNDDAFADEAEEEETPLEVDDESNDLLGWNIAHDRQKRKQKKPPKGWFTKIETDKNGLIKPTITNALLLVQFDSRLCGKIAYNELVQGIVVLDDIRPKIEGLSNLTVKNKIDGDPLMDRHDNVIRTILEAPNGPGLSGYGVRTSDRDLAAALQLAAHENSFDPRKEEYESLVWDGTERLDEWLPKYLETENTPYHREVGRFILLAMVVSTYEPGSKNDYMPILCGAQGGRKSTLIQILAGNEDRYGVFDCDINNKQRVAECIQGKAIVEMDEMESMKKADHTTNKSFLRKQHDDVRMAYGRHVERKPRTFTVIGSTNERKILRDPTGNRSYFPIIVHATPIDTVAFKKDLPQLNAEAYHLYRAMRKSFPRNQGWLDLSLGIDATKEAVLLQEEMRSHELFEEMRDAIEEFIDTPVSLSDVLREQGERLPEFRDLTETGPDPEDVFVLRTRWTKAELTEAALGRQRLRTGNPAEQLNMEKALDSLRSRLSFRRKVRLGGRYKRQCSFFHLSISDEDEVRQGYRILQKTPIDPLGF